MWALLFLSFRLSCCNGWCIGKFAGKRVFASGGDSLLYGFARKEKHLAKPNYQFEKRQRELSKKQKKEEKLRKKDEAAREPEQPAVPQASTAKDPS